MGTGFAGLSAATVITPMLVVFLGVPAYQASALHWPVMCWPVRQVPGPMQKWLCGHKKRNCHDGWGAEHDSVGSWLSSYVESSTLRILHPHDLDSGCAVLVFPYPRTQRYHAQTFRSTANMCWTGRRGVGWLICGFFGAGGGMMMLMVLTMLLGYELKTAVGTSVFVMTFSALTGAISHFALGDAPT